MKTTKNIKNEDDCSLVLLPSPTITCCFDFFDDLLLKCNKVVVVVVLLVIVVVLVVVPSSACQTSWRVRQRWWWGQWCSDRSSWPITISGFCQVGSPHAIQWQTLGVGKFHLCDEIFHPQQWVDWVASYQVLGVLFIRGCLDLVAPILPHSWRC